MFRTSRLLQLGCAALFATAATFATAYSPSYAPAQPFVKAALVQVDVYDRQDGAALPVYSKDGRYFIVGTPGHEYAVRIRNCTGARVLVVTSVDGVNVISGDTAAPGQTGYVIDAWSSVEIAGWRKSMTRSAAFYFTEHANSYAARTGRPLDVGVIGVAVFQERVAQVFRPQYEPRRKIAAAPSGEGNLPFPMSAPPASAAESDARAEAKGEVAASGARQNDELASNRSRDDGRILGKIGTGHGRSEASRATTVAFDRATEVPAEVVSLQYDRRENLVAQGVLPPPRLAQRSPDPFPAQRFAPDPPR